ncbi:MAG: PspC domain-containing protein [Actinomycetota bacterium]
MDDVTPHGLGEDLRGLRRSQSDRMVAGVLGGVAQRLRVDPLLLRIATVVLALFGGVGIVLYAIGWLLIPDEDADTSIAEQALSRSDGEPRDGTAVALAAGLLIVILIAAGSAFGSGFGTVLLVLAIVGVILLLRRQDGGGQPAQPAGYGGTSEQAQPETDGGAAGQEPGAGTGDQPTAAGLAPPRGTTDAPYEPPPGAGWPEPDWMPAADDDVYGVPAPPREPAPRSYLGPLTLSAVVVALGILAVNDATWATVPFSAYLATALAVVGLGLLAGAWFGRSRGLIVLGVVLAVSLVPAAFADRYSWETGSYRVAPTSIDELPSGPQSYGVGSVVYDLSGLELEDADSVHLEITNGIGELRVIVPADADVTVNAETDVGGIELFKTWSGGPDSNREVTDLGADGPGGGEITLELENGVGKVEVNR